MKRKIAVMLITVSFMAVLVSISQAQSRKITGKVTSENDGQPLAGVTVLVRDTTNIGVATDGEGNYSLEVPDNKNVLVFSYVGFRKKEIIIGNQTVINVQLKEDVQQLSDIVVVGYGTQIKQDLTGSVSTVSGNDIQDVPVTNFQSAIQGRSAGVVIQQGNGKLGQAINIRIRGSSSVSASNQPLIVIDGVPVTSEDQEFNTGVGSQSNPLADVNFEDIKSFEVLKDASAAAIYGSRASNGVILITTKSGQAGATHFSVKYSQGFSSPAGKRDFLNGQQYVDYFLEAAQNADKYGYYGGGNVDYAKGVFDQISAGTWQTNTLNSNWQDEAFNSDAGSRELTFSASGGNDKTTFYASGFYNNATGILINNHLQKISGRLNLDHHANDKLSLGIKLNIAKSTNQRLPDDDAFSTPLQVVAQPAISPIYAPGTNDYNVDNTLYFNGLLYKDNSTFPENVFHTLSNAYADYNLTKNLNFRSEFGLDLYDQQTHRWFGTLTAGNTGYSNGDAIDAWDRVVNYTLNNYFEYQKTFNTVNDIDATAGISYQRSDQNTASIEGVGYPNDHFRNINNAAQIIGGGNSETAFSFLSYFARANYKLKDRYLLKVSGRVDGSSRFGKSQRYGFFPAISAGWIISQESFLQDNPVISLLKARASYGITGNATGIGDFAARGLFNGIAYAGVSGTSPAQTPNPDLKWETTAQTDLGIDFGLLEQRVSGSLDFYQKKTTDLLLNVQVPATTGFTTQIRNVGKLQNKGFEAGLNTINTEGDFYWSTSFNFSINQNKITDLNGQIIEGGFINRAMEGQPIGVFYSRDFAGVNPANGDALYYLNHTPSDAELNNGTAFKVNDRFGGRYVTNDYNSADRVVIGDPNPDWTGAITNQFSYKGVNFSFMFYGVFGNQIYNGGGKYMSASGTYFDNQTTDQLNSWQKPGDITNVPEARLFGDNGTGDSSRYLSDGTYVRLKNVTLSYELPKSTLSKFGDLNRVKIFITGQNLLTITKYTGWDPEVNTDWLNGNLALGNDFYAAPQAKTISVGINLGF